jgi:hypothetical protein
VDVGNLELAEDRVVVIPADVACQPEPCNSTPDWRFAWCSDLCECVSACLCVQFDWDGSCLIWSDEWSNTGCSGPNPIDCW